MCFVLTYVYMLGFVFIKICAFFLLMRRLVFACGKVLPVNHSGICDVVMFWKVSALNVEGAKVCMFDAIKAFFEGGEDLLGVSDEALECDVAVKQLGFTLLEMLVVIAIFSIMSSLAVPRYQAFVAQREIELVSDEVAQGLVQGRVFAQSNLTNVRFCPIAVLNLNTALPACLNLPSNTPFPAWMVAQVDLSGNAVRVISRSDRIPSAVALTLNRKFIQFGELGSALSAGGGVANGTVTVSPFAQLNLAVSSRNVSVAVSGVVSNP